MYLLSEIKQDQTVQILILTYMRSGSSLTGDIMQQSPESYYHFEPLFVINKASVNYTVMYVNGSIR